MGIQKIREEADLAMSIMEGRELGEPLAEAVEKLGFDSKQDISAMLSSARSVIRDLVLKELDSLPVVKNKFKISKSGASRFGESGTRMWELRLFMDPEAESFKAHIGINVPYRTGWTGHSQVTKIIPYKYNDRPQDVAVEVWGEIHNALKASRWNGE